MPLICLEFGSDVTGGQTYDASSYTDYDHMAFDDNLGTYWATDSSLPQWIEVDYGSGTEKQVEKLRIYNGTSDQWPSEFQLKASNTGAFGGEEVTLLSKTIGSWSQETWKEWVFSNDTAYQYYRIYVTDRNHATWLLLWEVEMMECTGEYGTTTTSTTTSSSTSSTSSTASTASTTSTSSTTISTTSTSTTTTMPPNASFCVFRNVTIPENSVISKANVYLTAYEPNSGIPLLVDISFADEDDADPPTSKSDLDGRPETTGPIRWTISDVWQDNVTYKSPDLSTILQQVVDRSGWASGNKVMVKMTKAEGGNYRFWSAYEYLGGAEKAALRVHWLPPRTIVNPYISPEETFHLSSFTCTLSCYPTDASIYYTTDGSTPDQNSTLYTAPFQITADTTVKAKAYKQYWTPSGVSQRAYQIYTASVGTVYQPFGATPNPGGQGYCVWDANGFARIIVPGMGQSASIWAMAVGIGQWSSGSLIRGNISGFYAVGGIALDGSNNAHTFHISQEDDKIVYARSTGYTGWGAYTPVGSLFGGIYNRAGAYTPGGTFVDGSGYLHHFYWSYFRGINGRVIHLTNQTGDWTEETILEGSGFGDVRQTPKVVMRSDGATFDVMLVNMYGGAPYGAVFRSGSYGSWSGDTLVSGIQPWWADNSYTLYIDDSDNLYVGWMDGNSPYPFYIWSNISGSWALLHTIPQLVGGTSSGLNALMKDSNGYLHAFLWLSKDQVMGGGKNLFYSTNQGGSWNSYVAGLVDPGAYYQIPLEQVPYYDEVGAKLYCSYYHYTSTSPPPPYSATSITVIDK